jgi:hypothetical protein
MVRQRRGHAGGIPGSPPAMPPALVSHPLFALFYQVEIRHRQLLKNYPAPAQGTDIRQMFHAIMAI